LIGLSIFLFLFMFLRPLGLSSSPRNTRRIAKMTTDKVKCIGFIGLGNMGFWMVTNLADKLPVNSKIYIFDIVPALMHDVYAKYPEKVLACSSPKDVADKSVCIPKSLLTACLPKIMH
jgi:hypothetical protein